MPDSGIFKGSHPLGADLEAAIKVAREDPNSEPNHKIANELIFRRVGDYLWLLIKAEHFHGMNTFFTDTSLAALKIDFMAQFRAYASAEFPFTRRVQDGMKVLDWWRLLSESPQASVLAVCPEHPVSVPYD
jgi:hypothetical protein